MKQKMCIRTVYGHFGQVVYICKLKTTEICRLAVKVIVMHIGVTVLLLTQVKRL